MISKTKIVFFVKKGLDSFLDDVIKGLSEEYETKKIIVTEYSEIDKGIEWGDICWFEWCDELVIYGSKLMIASKKTIICRLHSYEAFSVYPSMVNWDNVNKLIFVGKHISKFIINNYAIDVNKVEVIPNGINSSKYSFKNREKGYNIAYVGYINYKKGPMLLLHVFKAIYDYDNKYKLFIAGKFQDTRYILYFNQMINKMGLCNNVFYEGWQESLDKWLDNKDYILCTSVLESQNISVMAAMVKGIKPVIHNFVGAESIYNEKYIWNTFDEAIKIAEDASYNSKEYRDYIINNYSYDMQMDKIKKLFS
jgi:glycosyltransferase involved in cell wall biosynthesis